MNEFDTVTIEQTGKRLKLHLACSFLTFVMFGIIAIYCGFNNNIIGLCFFIATTTISFVWFAITRVKIWWNHK